MTRPKCLVAVITGLALLLAIVAAFAQGSRPKVQQADVYADKWVYRWDKKTFEFTGNCRVEIKGLDRATMTASRMTGKGTGRGNEISEITAVGPVRFDITTAKDEEGLQRVIHAACAGQATYRGGDKVVVLSGGAEAVMTTLPEDPNIQPTKFTGSSMTISLDEYTIGGDNIHIELQIPAKEAEKKPQ